jgi:hypothetical protein
MIMVTLQVNMNQLLDMIKTLPFYEKAFLKAYIEKEIESQPTHSRLTERLLSGPVMSEEQYDSYIKLQNEFNTWSKKFF